MKNTWADHPGFDESNCIIKCWIIEQQQKSRIFHDRKNGKFLYLFK